MSYFFLKEPSYYCMVGGLISKFIRENFIYIYIKIIPLTFKTTCIMTHTTRRLLCGKKRF
jgi:hypothetical protein